MKKIPFWAPDTAWLHDEDEIPDAVEKLSAKHAREWQKYDKLVELYKDHAPLMWRELEHCRTSVRTQRCKSQEGDTWLVELEPCGKRPYCPACNAKWTDLRAENAARTFRDLTPKGEKPAVIGITFAPRRQDGEQAQWQQRAMADYKRYMLGVAHGIDDLYGGDTAILCTFQPYGNKLFVRDHPHVHALLSTWALRDGKPYKLPRLEIPRDGKEETMRPIYESVSKKLRCAVPYETLDIRIEEANPNIKGGFLYNFRELIDPLKFEYDRATGLVEITNWVDKHDKARFEAKNLRSQIVQYGDTYRDWWAIDSETRERIANKSGRSVDGWYGIAWKPNLDEAKRQMGGGREHGDNCKCGKCATWERPRHRMDLTRATLENEMRPW